MTPITIPNILRQTPAPISLKSGTPGAYRSLDGLAVVSAIAAADDPCAAAKHLRELLARGPRFSPRSQIQPAKTVTPELIVDKAAELLDRLRAGEKKPLVHHITVSDMVLRRQGDFIVPILFMVSSHPRTKW